jgi:hypothetical protein
MKIYLILQQQQRNAVVKKKYAVNGWVFWGMKNY